MANAETAVCESVCNKACVTLYFHINSAAGCASDKFPLGVQNLIISVILPHLLIENNNKKTITSPGVCFVTGETIYCEGLMHSAVCYLFLLFLPNTSCLSSGFLLPCVIVALVLCLIVKYNMLRDLRCFVGMQK